VIIGNNNNYQYLFFYPYLTNSLVIYDLITTAGAYFLALLLRFDLRFSMNDGLFGCFGCLYMGLASLYVKSKAPMRISACPENASSKKKICVNTQKFFEPSLFFASTFFKLHPKMENVASPFWRKLQATRQGCQAQCFGTISEN